MSWNLARTGNTELNGPPNGLAIGSTCEMAVQLHAEPGFPKKTWMIMAVPEAADMVLIDTSCMGIKQRFIAMSAEMWSMVY